MVRFEDYGFKIQKTELMDLREIMKDEQDFTKLRELMYKNFVLSQPDQRVVKFKLGNNNEGDSPFKTAFKDPFLTILPKNNNNYNSV